VYCPGRSALPGAQLPGAQILPGALPGALCDVARSRKDGATSGAQSPDTAGTSSAIFGRSALWAPSALPGGCRRPTRLRSPRPSVGSARHSSDGSHKPAAGRRWERRPQCGLGHPAAGALTQRHEGSACGGASSLGSSRGHPRIGVLGYASFSVLEPVFEEPVRRGCRTCVLQLKAGGDGECVELVERAFSACEERQHPQVHASQLL